MNRLTFIPYEVEFPILRSAQNPTGSRRGWVMRFKDDEGHVGFGDVAPWPGFGSTYEEVRAVMESGQPIADCRLPEVRGAAEWALADIEAQVRGVSLAKMLNPDARDGVLPHALVRDAMSARTAVASGFTALKVKVGRGRIDDDLARVAAIRDAAGDDVRLRLDANAAWSVDEACEAVSALAELDLDYVEQPVESLDDLRRVREATGVRIAADESVTTVRSLEMLVEARAADVVIIKPAFMGGVVPAMNGMRTAARCGLTCVVTHAFESVVGRMIALHVAASTPTDLPCGIAPQSAREAPGNYPEDLVDGRVPVPTVPGLGCGDFGGLP